MSLLNMEKLKFFIFLDCKIYLTLLYWTLTTLEAPSFIPKIHRNIWGLSLIENLSFANTSDFIPTKYCLWSSTWKCLEIQPESSFPIRNISFTEHVPFLLFSMAFHYGITIKHYYHIYLKSSTKYNKELCYRLQVFFVLLPL